MKSGYHPSRRAKKDKPTQKEMGFYHKPAWRKIRLVALQRDNYLCQECLRKKKITPATEVHHIRPLEDYPELGLELSNLESICWACHEETKRRKYVMRVGGVKILKIIDGRETEGWSNAD